MQHRVMKDDHDPVIELAIEQPEMVGVVSEMDQGDLAGCGLCVRRNDLELVGPTLGPIPTRRLKNPNLGTFRQFRQQLPCVV
jgi:hypothetical protein